MHFSTTTSASTIGRRAILAGVFTAPLLAACGSTDGESVADPSGGAGFPVTIEHMFGETEVPSAPKKVLTLGLSDQDSVLALGVVPIAVSEWYGEYDHATWPWAEDELGDAEPVVLNDGVRDEENPPIEEIASLEPDLIISLYNGTTKEQYDQLSEIAPTLVPQKKHADFNITWRESMRVVGQALGKDDEAAEIVSGIEKKFADAAKKHPEFTDVRVIVAERFEPGESVVRSGNDIRATFFEDLGFTVPSEVAGKKPDKYGETAVSDENIDALSEDLLVWNVGANPEVRKQVESISLYKTLPVVKDDRVLWVSDPEISGAFSWGTALSLEFALDKILPQLTKVVD